MSFTQANRLLAIETTLGVDILLIEHFTCAERISGLFSLRAQCAVELPRFSSVNADQLVGSSVNIRLGIGRGDERIWNGIVRRITHTQKDNVFAYFTLDLVPKFWRLSHMTDCRIYQEKTVPAIVEELLRETQILFRFDLQKEHKSWDYCVQYRESFFAFISRLLEQEGLFYFFEHQRDQHTLVIADHPQIHAPCPIQAVARYRPNLDAGTEDDSDLITHWESAEELRPGLFTMRDHHFQLPSRSLEVSESSVISLGGNGSMEVFDFPGEYAQLFVEPEQRLDEVQAEGQKSVRLRTEAEEVAVRSFSGSGIAVTLAAGFRFELQGHYVRPLNGQYVLTTVQHQSTQTPAYLNDQPVHSAYRNSFACIPLAVPYRPPRQTPKPFVRGAQTAVVTGPENEEIHTDKFGRIKVRFFWDRKSTGDAKSSCWIRVATPWAGQNWGMVHIPRIGQEVVVEFLEGDPDQPLVIGSVYNADQMPPYTLPKHGTQSGIKTRSSKEGTPENFNELRFEDSKGHEQVYLHAERTLTTVVEASESRSVGGSRTTTIHKDDKRTVKEGDYTLIIEKKDRTVEIEEGDDTATIDKGDKHITVTLGGMTTEVPAGTYKVTAKEIALEATTKITLKVGPSSIELTPTGVKVVGPMIDLNP